MSYDARGKFNSQEDEDLYDLSLDSGQDEEIGDCGDLGWFGLFKSGLAILCEDGQGFITVDRYKTTKDLMLAWEYIEEDYERYYEENEDAI